MPSRAAVPRIPRLGAGTPSAAGAPKPARFAITTGWRAAWTALLAQRKDTAWVKGAGALGLVSGAVHLAFSPAHFEEAAGQGLFFLILGAAQMAWAIWFLSRASWSSHVVGVGLATSPILIYAVVLWVPPPFGTAAETLDYPALVTKLIELSWLTFLAGCFVPSAHQPRWTPRRAGAAVSVSLVLGIVLGAATLGAGYAAEPLSPSLAEPSGHQHAEAPGATPEPSPSSSTHAHAVQAIAR